MCDLAGACARHRIDRAGERPLAELLNILEKLAPVLNGPEAWFAANTKAGTVKQAIASSNG